LPGRYDGLVYHRAGEFLPHIYSDFLADANEAPVLRIATVISVLSKLASDTQVGEDIRQKIDREKTDTLFWQIVGQEKSVESKTSTGSAWKSDGFVQSLPKQLERILDDCHLFTKMVQWKESFGFHKGSLELAEQTFEQLADRLQDPIYAYDLLNKLAMGTTVEAMLQMMYTWFIKLGIIERIIWSRTDGMHRKSSAHDPDRDTKSADDWAVETLASPVARTRDCVRKLCDQLYVKSQGSLDDAARAEIREVSISTGRSIVLMLICFAYTTQAYKLEWWHQHHQRP
jgi:hypothetical protein